MTADEIARALGDARRSGGWWRCRCPVHRSRGDSLALRDGERGLIVKCFAGCDPGDVLAELRQRGLTGGGNPYFPPAALARGPAPAGNDVATRIAAARCLWNAAQSAQGGPAILLAALSP
jgi:putative DNA primase/helicase